MSNVAERFCKTPVFLSTCEVELLKSGFDCQNSGLIQLAVAEQYRC